MKLNGIEICDENRFTKYVRHKADLDCWRDWFVQRGIPYVIVNNNGGYAIYRNGLIPIDLDDED